MTSLRIIIFTSLIIFLPNPTNAATSGQLKDIGAIDVTATPYNATPNDNSDDDTTAFQQALDDAYQNRQVVIVPPGTYNISDTLKGKIIDKQEFQRKKAYYLIGSTKGARPIIKLKSSSPGFNDPNNPKPVIRFWTEYPDNPGNDAAADGFSGGIRNIEIHTGTGNPGAIGLNFTGAQENILHNVKIDLSDSGHIGMKGLLGTNSVINNIEIIGGKYGIYAPSIVKWPSITNLTLRNQSTYAIYKHRAAAPVTIAGFKIIKDQAPAIKSATLYWDGAYAGGNLSLIDGTIEFNSVNGKPAIDNHLDDGSSNRSITLRNVYTKNASSFIQSADFPPVTAGSGWAHIDSYGSPIQKHSGLTNIDFNIINGVKNTTEHIGNISHPNSAPQDMRLFHTITISEHASPDHILDLINNTSNKIGTLNNKTIINVLDHGVQKSSDRPGYLGNDDGFNAGPKIQELLNKYDILFFPTGLYVTKQTLTLNATNHIMGVTNFNTEIRTHEDWHPPKSEWESRGKIIPLITTVDSKNAAPKMSYLNISWHTKGNDQDTDWFSGFDWKSGRNSEIVNIMFQPLWGPQNDDYPGNPRIENRITGNGGGKWFGAGFFFNQKLTYHPDFRRLVVQNTSEPLIFYGLNIEDGHGDYQAEFINAKNVAIYGSKSENSKDIYIRDSSNIVGYGLGGSINMKVENSNNVFLGNISPKFANDPENGNPITEIYAGKTTSVTHNQMVTIFQRGTPNFSTFRYTSSIPLPQPDNDTDFINLEYLINSFKHLFTIFDYKFITETYGN